jgi:hypothetical protein
VNLTAKLENAVGILKEAEGSRKALSAALAAAEVTPAPRSLGNGLCGNSSWRRRVRW